MSSEARQFRLSLQGGGSVVVGGGPAVCLVTSTTLQFTAAVRENIKFAVSRRTEQGKERVTNRQDLCNLSEDLRQFSFGFDVTPGGSYKVVVVLGSEHVEGSPLKVQGAAEEQEAGKVQEAVAAMASLGLANSAGTGALQLPHKVEGLRDGRKATKIKETGSIVKIEKVPTVEKEKAQTVKDKSKITSASMAAEGLAAVPGLVGELARAMATAPSALGVRSTKPFPRLAGIKEGLGEAELHRPIGLCLLRDGRLVVASTFDDKVKMFLPDGKLDRLVRLPEGTFSHPSDMATLSTGNFVVRDDRGVHEFSASGGFVRQLPVGAEERGAAKCFGLAQDEQGRLVTIVEARGRPAALVSMDLATCRVVHRRELGDVVDSSKGRSKCRFLTHADGRLYVTDLGLDMVYVLEAATGALLQVFGRSGAAPDCFCDPAGLAADGSGGVLVADSRNHRVVLYSREGR